MKIKLLLLLCLFFYQCFGQSDSYKKAWLALNENKWDEAVKLLNNAGQDPSSVRDAYISNIYLQSYKGKSDSISDFSKSFYSITDNPYPYIYALWHNDALIGPAGKKRFDRQVNFLNQVVNDSKAPGTLVGSANYQLGLHYLFCNKLDKAKTYFESVGSIKNWQYTGPFENLSQSGFYKKYPPIEHPEPTFVFKSLTNADIKWFVPSTEIRESWFPVSNQFNNKTAVVYAQNFVQSTIDQTVFCTVGFSGSIKVWINDKLIIAESNERLTEMDSYIAKCDLKKGTNRILIQLGFTDNSYPNFIVRFTDDKLRVLQNVTGSSTYSPYPKNTDNEQTNPIKLFAEEYFSDQIDKNPENLLNYLLLTDVYLRNKKLIEARDIITKAIDKAPNNCLLKLKLAEILVKEDNQTLLLEEVEKIKQLDPESLLVMELSIKEDLKNQKYEDADKELEKRISIYGEDENTADYKLGLLAEEKKYEDLVKEVERLYAKFPDDSKLIDLMYSVKKEVYKDNKGAIQVYETFLKNNYDYDVISKYADILSEQGDNEKSLQIKKSLSEEFPYSSAEFYNLSKYYYGTKEYNKAEEYINKSLAISPYNEVYWEQMGDIKSEENNIKEALNAYEQSLQYDPNQYIIIAKIRKLNNKPEAFKLFPQVNIDSTIKADKVENAKNIDYGFYYILDQKDVIVYPGGATEEYFTSLIRITNEKGIDKFKESSISYSNTQTLLIEEADVVKKNQTRIKGDRNENDIVFANLEAGDVIVFKYRIRNYAYGRFAKEYWDKYFFVGQIYTGITRYDLFVSSNQKIYYQFENSALQPTIKDVENFKEYSWELKDAEPEKDEDMMPLLCDVAPTLHISTIPTWNEIANWYSDICNNKAEEDAEIQSLYKKLFPDKQKIMTQFQKARIIYNYIESNIRYSSVSFRQSAFVPQRPSKTLTTRLGDCKDLSSLFITLAQMAGIKAQMVLVDTRDNGQKDILLPSVEFNHCIAKVELDSKYYYIELTDNDLPFASLPNDLNGAIILEIPNKLVVDKSELQLLQTGTRTRDIVKRTMDITPTDQDLDISVKTTKYGNASSFIRSTFKSLDNDKQLKEMEKEVAQSYKNNIKLSGINFKYLDKLDDSVEFTYNFKVKNEISEIGSLNTFKIIYPDIVASLNNFSTDSRTYPFEYWNYEDVDTYETTVNVTAPKGNKFVELPTSESFSFKDMNFSIQYILKSPDKLTVIRKFTNGRKNISAIDYPGFKNFFEKIVKAEQKFIAYRP